VYREQSTTGVADAETPAELRLGQNYPNPFNPTTNIEFALQNSGLVSLKVFDVLGREVATVVHENMQRGSYTVQFDGRDLSSGIYVYRLTAGGKSISRKFTLMK
jgi:hypothetical protein